MDSFKALSHVLAAITKRLFLK